MKLIDIVLVFSLMTACIGHKEKNLNIQVKLIGDSGYRPNAIPDLRDSTLVFLFSSNFKNDSVEIRVDSTSKKLLLNTEPTTGSATTFIWGKLKNQKEVILKLNDNKPLKFRINSNNQLFVIKYLYDTLKIESVYHFRRLE